MTEAYENALRELKIERSDLITERLALLIVEIAKAGEEDPARMCARAIEGLDLPERSMPPRPREGDKTL